MIKPVVIGAIAALGYFGLKRALPMNYSGIKTVYFPLAVEYGEVFGIDPFLILAIVKQESAGIPSATGSIGEIGLMQISKPALIDYNNRYGSSFRMIDLFNIRTNIRIGSWYLSQLIKNYGLSEYDALRAYNGGIGNVLKGSSISTTYATSVQNHKLQLEGI